MEEPVRDLVPPEIVLEPAPQATPLADAFDRYAAICLLFGIFYAFCFYKNPGAITWPLFIAVGFGLILWLFRELGIPFKKDSRFLIVCSLLLAISNCLTASPILYRLNKAAIFLLTVIFFIHQFYDDKSWNIGKYAAAVIEYLTVTVTSFPIFFNHLFLYTKKPQSGKGKNLLLVCAGVAASIPLALLVVLLLGAADAVFAEVIVTLFINMLSLKTVILVSLEILVSAIGLYCVLCSGFCKSISAEIKDRRHGNPIAAVSFLTVIVLPYVLFCAIQIYYLLLRQGTLPRGFTYSQYAHQGFFQLVFVIIINLLLVLSCLKFFQSGRLLRAMLTTVSLCTYVMIASAAYRMILYISCYRLTFLRLLVLWFLALVAVLMAGIIRLIYRETFPLFRFCVVVVSVFYICLSLSRPDAIIARYNLTTGGPLEADDYRYLQSLSADAAPALDRFITEEDLDFAFARSGERERFFNKYYSLAAPNHPMTLRSYNFSRARLERIYFDPVS